MADPIPEHNFNVTEVSGYTFEKRTPFRNSNGFGGTQTTLPRGHLARRDTPAVAKNIKVESDG